MHTVCELKTFRRDALDAGMTQEDIDGLVDFLSRAPTAGDEIPGTGGCRKLRVAGRDKGKSGGYRTITFYSGESMPLFLLTVFSKGERSDLSQAEGNDLAALTKVLVSEYRKRNRKIHDRQGPR